MVISNGDTAFANDWRRAALVRRGVPPKAGRARRISGDFAVSKRRRLVERFVCDRTQFRRIAARHEKTDVSDPAAIHLAATRFALECMSTGPRARA